MRFEIKPIKGDASFRHFYRIVKNKNSKIIISANKEKYKNLVVYSAINNYLRKNKILTPKLFFHNYKKGVIIIEDFGDLSFYQILLKKKNKLIIYTKLVNLLLKIQKIKPKIKIKTITGQSYMIKKYSNQNLHKESDLFFDWYLPLYMNKKRALKIKKKGKKILAKLYNSLNFPNSCLVHRDFHVQNLMKVGKKIGVIDSQDAVIGNQAYDLMSLIDDVRLKSSEKLKKKIYRYYLKKSPKINKKNQKEFSEDFNILSVQRNLKIIGIFSRLFKRDKKDKYLKYIPYTWKLLEARMNKEIFSKLKKLLDKNIPKKVRKFFILK
jgi:aminoglycoside/choline kinase family phosphotransferase